MASRAWCSDVHSMRPVQCKAARAEHREKHSIYIRLHKERQAHQAEIQGLQVSLQRHHTDVFPALSRVPVFGVSANTRLPTIN